MAVEDNVQITEEEDLDEALPVDVEIQPEGTVEETPEPEEQNFYGNLAEDMDEVLLSRLANDLLADYKKDKESRSDWEKSYACRISNTISSTGLPRAITFGWSCQCTSRR